MDAPAELTVLIVHATGSGKTESWLGLEGRERYAACLTAAKNGNRHALEVLVAELTPLIWHVARGNSLDHTTAEDVVQTVWLAFLRHLDRLAEPRALVGWLITTTRREASRVRRRNALAHPLSEELIEKLVSDHPLPEATALQNERDNQLIEAFRRLPTRDQDVIRLLVLGETSYHAAATSLGIERSSIGPLRHRALRKLRDLFEDVSTRPPVVFLPRRATQTRTGHHSRSQTVVPARQPIGVAGLHIPRHAHG